MYYSNYSDDFSQNSYLKVELRNGLTGQNYTYQYNWGNNWGNSWDDDFGLIGGTPSTPRTPSTPCTPWTPSTPSLYDDRYYY